MRLFINFAAFQIGWFSSVLGAANGMPWLGPLVLAFVLALHLSMAERPRAEIGLVLACAAIGTWFDSFFVAAGWIAYPSGQWHAMLAPYWIVSMWMLFATTLNVSMAWLKGRPLLAAVTGGIAGPLSYVAGQKLGGLEFLDATAAIWGLALGWAIALPAVVWLAARLEEQPQQEIRV